MSTAILPPAFQDLTDGPGELGPADEGKVPAWSWADRRLIMIPLPQPGSQQIIVRGGGGSGGSGEGGTTNHAALLNLDYASAGHTGFEPAGAGTAAVAAHVAEADPHEQYLLEADYTAGVSDHALLTHLDYASSGHTGFEASGTAAAAISTHVGLSDPHTQYALESALGTMATATETNYLKADGTRTGGTSQTQVFSGGVRAQTSSDYAELVVESGSPKLRIFDAGVINAEITVDIQGINFSHGITSNGLFRTTGGALVSGLSTLTATGLIGLFSANGTPCFISFSERLSGNRGSIGFAAGSNDLLVSFGSEQLLSGTERLRLTNSGVLTLSNANASTSAIQNAVTMRSTNSGTPAAGFGVGFRAGLKSSTTADQDAGRLTYEWVTATHASRASRGKLSAYYTSTEQEAMRWDGDTGGLKLGFYGVAAVARQVLATGAGASVDDVITALQALGLVKQS